MVFKPVFRKAQGITHPPRPSIPYVHRSIHVKETFFFNLAYLFFITRVLAKNLEEQREIVVPSLHTQI